MSHSQFHSIKRLYLDMHGLIFETSVWLLAESTRLLSFDVTREPSFGTTATRIIIMSFILLNFIHSIIRIYCMTNAARTKYNITYIQSGSSFAQQSTTQISKASFYILRVKQARTAQINVDYFTSKSNSSHMSTLFARYTRWTPGVLLELTTWFLVRFTKTISLLIK